MKGNTMRIWQIRTTDEYGEETCDVFYSAEEAQTAYDAKLTEETDGYLELELLEVMQQHTLKP